MHLAKNDTRVLFLDKNQTLLIRFTALEDEGIYMCNVSNRLGSATVTNTLTLIGMLTTFITKLLNCIKSILKEYNILKIIQIYLVFSIFLV